MTVILVLIKCIPYSMIYKYMKEEIFQLHRCNFFQILTNLSNIILGKSGKNLSMGDQEVGVPNDPMYTNYFDISLSQVILPVLSDDPIINDIFDDKSDDILDDCFENGV